MENWGQVGNKITRRPYDDDSNESVQENLPTPYKTQELRWATAPAPLLRCLPLHAVSSHQPPPGPACMLSALVAQGPCTCSSSSLERCSFPLLPLPFLTTCSAFLQICLPFFPSKDLGFPCRHRLLDLSSTAASSYGFV